MLPVCFVFGSNLRGIHGAGAAKEAKEKWGALLYFGVGCQNNSYAIPTKDENLDPLPLEQIEKFVEAFIGFARLNSDVKFILTPIGCGLANYKPEQIAPFFKEAPSNVYLPREFVQTLKGM